MTNQIDHIVEHFFHKKRLDDVSVYELERFIATHPYFAAGHFLLARKTQLEQSHDIYEKISATALYYNNPLWLQWLLELDHNSSNIQETGGVLAHETDIDVTEDEFIKSRDSSDNDDEASYAHTESISEENETGAINIDETPDDKEFSSSEAPTENQHDDEQLEVAIQSHQHWDDNQQQLTGEETSNTEKPGFADENTEHKEYEEVGHGNAEIIESIAEPQMPNVEEFSSADTEVESDNASAEEDPQEEESPVTNAAVETSAEDEPEVVHDVADEEAKASAAGIERTLSMATLIPAKAEIDKNELTFEPYHTIDYFASQGIKLQQSDLSKDKFGKQLKSFTDWLRSMKRLPQAAVETNMDEAAQQSIQQIAEHSFEEKDIVTETMAEVWIKQGNKEKAIDTLQKLSLLNPSKSHYFAAKIEQLNAS